MTEKEARGMSEVRAQIRKLGWYIKQSRLGEKVKIYGVSTRKLALTTNKTEELGIKEPVNDGDTNHQKQTNEPKTKQKTPVTGMCHE